MAVRKPLVMIGGVVRGLPAGDSISGAGEGGGGGGGGPTLQGDTSPYATQTKTYQVTNYNSFSSYTVSASAGTASISGDTITFTAGAAYTAAVPAQTAAAAFRTGGTEAYEFGSMYYWSSSDYSASLAWYQYWSSSVPGYQGNVGKTVTNRVRAVRRSVI